MHPLIEARAGQKLLLLGNEAIARGALEAGLRVGAAYPGTPSSEIGNNLFQIQHELPGLYFEFSTNEKVAMEVAAAAAATGLRSLTCMKHVGLNVASDPLMTLAYIGVRGGMVIVVADDPSCHSSQNEQDSRYYARLSGLPLLEPATPEEAYQMTRFAFELSEKLELPVLLRTTTRVSHARGVVEVGTLPSYDQPIKGKFEKDTHRWVPIPAVARVRHQVLLEKMKEAQRLAESSSWNRTYGKGPLGIITSSVAANYVEDAFQDLNLFEQIKVLNLGFTHPWPVKLIADFLKQVEKVLVVEELEPYLEEAVKVVAQEEGIKVAILGKHTGHLPRYLEFDPGQVKLAIARAFSLDLPKPETPDISWVPELPPRPPTLCPGCPHRETYNVIKDVLKELGILENTIFPTDIGCYTLGILPPIQMADYLICMGSSVGAPCGFSVATDHRIVSFIGDSTFFHAGLSPLASAVFNKHKFTLVVLDNETTAMTGHQPVPSQELRPKVLEDRPRIDIEEVVRALGVKNVVTINPYQKEKAKEAVRPILEKNELSVIIAKAPCVLYRARLAKKK
ncbi:indolepyruvate ferredoxin oxidoreductase, alpha subunit [Thermodesulfatator indicus DSM 15286]|uniref:Indolepyruvate oxidoreductase subunit IorA n=1 Tax=Thermodesulfatator indicus (strain DSM 15286 / JCM 11887 / CIR29812) TaxID=667014 RepID=F8A8H1_THEID|nr:indolepyruvate ferredoxin oxidoreductase subunit alpha [Thermodesulfatator indicus]AEH43980.1 indolepyruvate ferredoxin oxidoreductase, alpha subunit [Thermodesulfatator indicus DSM 15286]